MKNLTYKEFLDAPAKIQFLYKMGIAKHPVGRKILEDAIKENPEYFPDEIEHRRKWALIPQQVHDDYWKEMEILKTEMYKDMPESKGILGWIDDPKGYEEWSAKWSECYEKEQPLAKALHQKFYGRYGIQWNGL